ncbi:MAG: hypothetical protein ACKVH5_09720, partial [Fidelibacterota bacterium]
REVFRKNQRFCSVVSPRKAPAVIKSSGVDNRLPSSFLISEALTIPVGSSQADSYQKFCSLQNYRQLYNRHDWSKSSRHLYYSKGYSKVNRLKNRGFILSFFPLFDA